MQSRRYSEAARYLESLDPPGYTAAYAFEHGIPRARHMLERLGGGPGIVQRCVLVTGSKGKGSTVTLIAQALAAAGYRVGAYTGPHLHRPTERFAFSRGRAGLRDMPSSVFVELTGAVRGIVETWDRPDLGMPTRFEAYTAMAYRWFERERADIAVMEIGIGGRLDAVNLSEPMVSVITNISLEHTQMLGATHAAIATEKSGIMRAAGIGVSAAQSDEGARALREAAAAIGAPLRFAEERWACHTRAVTVEPGRIEQTFVTRAWDEPLAIPLLGAYQLQNAAAALCALDALRERGFSRLTPAAIRAGFARARWPARFEVLHHAPLVIADGAHTPYSMEQLGKSLRLYFDGRRIRVVVGVLRDKDARNILRALAGFADDVILTEPRYHRAIPVAQLAALWAETTDGRPATGVVPPASAIRDALSFAGSNEIVVVTGSLHLAADVMTVLGPASVRS
jgi:dihydrofolate synthase/folylpolyglutamate synthase